MIDSLSIKNFRGIAEGELELDNLSILIGSNNAGKTTILEALFLLPNPLRLVPYFDDGGSQSNAIQVLHDTHQTLNSQGYLPFLHNYSAEHAQIKATIDENDVVLNFYNELNSGEILIQSNKATQSRSSTFNNSVIDYFGTLSKGNRNYRSWDQELHMKNSLLLSSNLLKKAYNYLFDNWGTIMNRGITRKVAETSSQFSNDKYMDITLEPFLSGQSSLNAYFKEGKRIRFGDIGEGMQNFITSTLLFELINPEILLWDDIEAHLNPRMLSYLANWFADLVDQGKQIVITTHSLEAARMIAGIVEKSSIYLMNIKDGILVHERMSFEKFNDITKKGIDPRVSERFLL